MQTLCPRTLGGQRLLIVRTGTGRLLHKPPDAANCPTNDAPDLVVDDPGNQDEQKRNDQEEAARAGRAYDGQGNRADQQQERAQDNQEGDFEQALGLGIPWSAKAEGAAGILGAHAHWLLILLI